MQRDLCTAFLARCVGEGGLLHIDLARERWSGAGLLIRAAWRAGTPPASGRAFRPSSFGASPRTQSGSPAKEGTANTEAPGGCSAPWGHGESRGEAEVQ